MNRFSSIIAVSMVALTSVVGVANAAPWSGASIKEASIDKAVAALKGAKFTVVDTDTLNAGDFMANPENYSDNVKPLHKAIAANKKLSAELTAQNIELRNIVGVEEALDGSFIFFVQ